MRFLQASFLSATLIFIVLGAGAMASRTGTGTSNDVPMYSSDGRLFLPANYREWVYLSSGLDMSYGEAAAATNGHVFDNVFAAPAAYAAFKKTGKWPDKTVLILENRSGSSKGSINKSGYFQTADIVGLEVHVKDEKRFKGGWGFFAFGAEKSAAIIPYDASCYSCHQKHGASDTTFVQFYPTLRSIAAKFGTVSRSPDRIPVDQN
jgi:Cytochrome P460